MIEVMSTIIINGKNYTVASRTQDVGDSLTSLVLNAKHLQEKIGLLIMDSMDETKLAAVLEDSKNSKSFFPFEVIDFKANMVKEGK